MTSFPWLSLIVFLPLAGALLCLLVKAESARWLALGVTVADFALSLPLWWLFDSSTAGMQFVERASWISSPPVQYSLGLDGISTEAHSCNAVALEDSEVCVIAYDKLEQMSHEIEGLQLQFHKVMSREIVRDHGVMMLLGSMRAEERLAAFLLNMSQRFTARGFSPSEFNLRMTREEIGSYLGLKLETVSRAFSRFQEDGLISVQQKHVHLLDPAGLKRLIQHQHGAR